MTSIGEIAVGPHAGVRSEVGRLKPLAIRISEESQRDRGKGVPADEIPCTPGCAASDFPVSSEDIDGQPQRGALDLPEYTGRVGSPSTKQPQMSVPPLILARCTSRLTSR